MTSASGLPTPKTVCVRELARFGHFTHAVTRSLIAASLSVFSFVGRGVGDGSTESRRTDIAAAGAALSITEWGEGVIRFNVSSAVREAHGCRAPSLRMRSRVSKTVSSACGNCINAYWEVLRESANDFDLSDDKVETLRS